MAWQSVGSGMPEGCWRWTADLEKLRSMASRLYAGGGPVETRNVGLTCEHQQSYGQRLMGGPSGPGVACATCMLSRLTAGCEAFEFEVRASNNFCAVPTEAAGSAIEDHRF